VKSEAFFENSLKHKNIQRLLLIYRTKINLTKFRIKKLPFLFNVFIQNTPEASITKKQLKSLKPE
jgi:hypothetical protein